MVDTDELVSWNFGTLLADLAEFVNTQRPDGFLTADATEPTWNGYLLTFGPVRGGHQELDQSARGLPPSALLSGAFQQHYGFRRESHNGVTERRNLALPNPPYSPVAALVGHEALRRAAIPRPSLHDHFHSTQAGESPLEMVVERRVVWAHDDEHFGIGK